MPLLRLVEEDRTGQELREAVAAYATVSGKSCEPTG
jgi:hypothetical protein